MLLKHKLVAYFPAFFLLLTFLVSAHVAREHSLYDVCLFTFAEVCFMAQDVVCLGRVPVSSRGRRALLLLDGKLHKC